MKIAIKGFTLKCNKCGSEVDFKNNYEVYCRDSPDPDKTEIFFDIGVECEIDEIKCNKCGNKIKL